MVAAVLLASLVCAVVCVGVLWHELSTERAETQAGIHAEAAARRAAKLMTTYDYRTVDADLARAGRAGTEKFRDYLAEASRPVRALVGRLRAHAEGEVVDSAAKVRDERHVRVLLFLDQTLSRPSSGRQVDQSRMTLWMVRQDDRWLVDRVQLEGHTLR